MRTLKKTLCLVLALVLCFALVGTAFAGNIDKYADADKVGAAYVEAADVMIGTGIINGMSETEIGATGTLTRAQAAKIVAYMKLGGKMAETMKTTSTVTFKDVPADHWAAGYIAYCSNAGIIDGIGGGKFDPEGALTGYAFAKMLLIAMGVKGDFTGEGWAIAVAQAAFQPNVNLFKGDEAAATNAPIQRQQAMLMAFNGLNYSATGTMKYVLPGGLKVDTLMEAYILNGSDLTGVTTEIPSDTIAAKFNLKQTLGVNAKGENYRMWYIDNDKNGLYDPTKDAAASDQIVTDLAVGTFAKGAKIKDAVAAAGKKATESLTVDLYMNGKAWTTGITWAGNDTSALIPDSNCTLNLVKTADGSKFNALYEYVGLYQVTSVAKLSGADKGKANFTFTLKGGVAAGLPVETSVVVKAAEGTYTKDAMYMVATDGVKLISCTEAAAPAVGKVTAEAAAYVKVGETKYVAANANVAMPSFGQTKVFYLNAAGEVMFIADPATPAATIYEGYVYVVASEYQATAGSLTGLINGGKDATIVAKANIVTEAGEAKVADLATKIVPATTSNPSKAQYWNGTAFTDATTGAVQNNPLAAGWYAYVTDAAGALQLTSVAGLTKALSGVTAKAAAITVASTPSFMTKTTEIKLVNYDPAAKAVKTTVITGYNNVTDAGVLNGKNAIVTADTSNVVSSITIFSASVPAAVTKYAVYAGLGELTVDGQYYSFYVDGEIVGFLAGSSAVATTITGLTGLKVCSYEVAGKNITACTDKGAGTSATIAQVQDGYVVVGTSDIVNTAPTMVVIDGTTGANNAVTTLAVGDTVTYFTGALGIEFAVITAHAA